MFHALVCHLEDSWFQRHKNACSVGHLPHRSESMAPFEQIAFDAIAPLNCKTNGIKMKVNACAIISTCSNPLEMKRATQSNPAGKEMTQVSEDTWLFGHPKPVRIANVATFISNASSPAKESRASLALLSRIHKQTQFWNGSTT